MLSSMSSPSSDSSWRVPTYETVAGAGDVAGAGSCVAVGSGEGLSVGVGCAEGVSAGVGSALGVASGSAGSVGSGAGDSVTMGSATGGSSAAAMPAGTMVDATTASVAKNTAIRVRTRVFTSGLSIGAKRPGEHVGR
jgi:hypothetical protein